MQWAEFKSVWPAFYICIYMFLVEKKLEKNLCRLLLQRVNWLLYSNKYFTNWSPGVTDSWHGKGTGMLVEFIGPMFLTRSVSLQFFTSKMYHNHPPTQDCVNALLGSK